MNVKRLLRPIGVLVAVGAAMLTSAPTAGALPPDPQYTVTIKVSSELGSGYECLGVYGTTAGTWVRTANCTTFKDRWDIVPGTGTWDSFFIRWSGTNMCLTTPSWKNYEAILYPCEGHGDQLWYQRQLASDQQGYLTEFTPAFDTSRRLTSPPWSTATMSYTDTPYPDQEFWVDWY
jgi:hypothetical protein